MRSKYAFPEWPGLVIFQREDAGDNWYVRFSIKVKGLRPYKIQLLREGGEESGSPTTSLETAKQWALMQYGAVMTAIRKGDAGALFDKTLEDVITEYVAEVQSDRTRGKTAVKRATMAAIPLKRYFKEVGVRLIARITTEIAKGYIDWRHKQVTYRGRTVAPTTVMHEMQILNQIFDYAIDKRYMRHEDRPKATFSVSLKNRTKRDGFTTDEWKVLEAWLWEWPKLTLNGRTRERREQLRDYCIFLYYSGMRPGEAMMRDYLLAIAIFCNGAKGVSALQLSRDLDVQYKTAFVLAHKLREAMAAEDAGAVASGEVEIDGAYFGGYVKPANWKENRRDRRLRKNQNGKRRVVIVARERNGKPLTFVVKSEDAAVPTIHERVAPGSTIHADEAPHWDQLHARYLTKRINHSEVYSDGESCTNQAESFFSRLRRAEFGTYHHVAGPYLAAYAAEMDWREDHRRVSNGEQFMMVVAAAASHPVSRQWKGYWQRCDKP